MCTQITYLSLLFAILWRAYTCLTCKQLFTNFVFSLLISHIFHDAVCQFIETEVIFDK